MKVPTLIRSLFHCSLHPAEKKKPSQRFDSNSMTPNKRRKKIANLQLLQMQQRQRDEKIARGF